MKKLLIGVVLVDYLLLNALSVVCEADVNDEIARARLQAVVMGGHELKVLTLSALDGYAPPTVANELGMIVDFTATAFVAHDVLAGRYIQALRLGDVVKLRFEDGRLLQVMVIARRIVDVGTPAKVAYGRRNVVVFQTCAEDGLLIVEAARS